MHQLFEQLLIGIQIGSIYALIALGYTMVYGVLKLINFAHGDVYMVGAYAGLGAATVLGSAIPGAAHSVGLLPSPIGAAVVLAAAIVVGAVLGLVIEQAAYRPLRTRSWVFPSIVIGGAVAYVAYQIAIDENRTPASSVIIGLVCWIGLGALLATTQRRRAPQSYSRLTALITAIGVSLFLENFGVLPQIFSAEPRFMPTLVTLPNTVPFLGLNVSASTLMIFGLSLVLMAVLTLIVTKTKMGKAIRAVSFDSDAAALMGINTDRVVAFTFALGAGLAGAAGVMVTGLTGTKFDPYVGVTIGLKAFVAAVLGGIGSIPGAMLGGLIMGLAETLVVAYGSSTYRDAVAFLLLILILLVRPAGLLGRAAAEKV